MAGHEDEAEQVVPELLFDRRVLVQTFLSPLGIAPDLFVLSLESLAAPDQVDRAVPRGSHEPGARPLRHAFGGPLLGSGDQPVLCYLLSPPACPHHATPP